MKILALCSALLLLGCSDAIVHVYPDKCRLIASEGSDTRVSISQYKGKEPGEYKCEITIQKDTK
jgi:hypothetical protein